MPVYEYKCECGNEFSQFVKMKFYMSPQPCGVCGEMAKRCVSQTNAVKGGPIVQTNLGPEPMTFRDKKELSKYCKENNLRSGALL